MAAAQHKLARREVLGAACTGAALPFSRHCEERSDVAIQFWASTLTAAGLLRSARDDERWQKALARYGRAAAGLEALAHVEEDGPYDRALGRHNAALVRLLGTPAPDLGAAAAKLDLILRHSVFELSFGEVSLVALRRDVRRFGAHFVSDSLGCLPPNFILAHQRAEESYRATRQVRH